LWTHLARQTGGRAGAGGVGLRGPGETQLESDRRDISRRIGKLKDELEEVRTHRRQYRKRRQRAGIPVVAIVGYTNAGKSTLLNALSGARVLAENKLFATLDPTTRRVALPDGREALFTDTVGFIQKLPTDLVAAFRATLEEIREADIIVQVVDATHPTAWEQSQAVEGILDELNVSDKPEIVALNKVDELVGERHELDVKKINPDGLRGRPELAEVIEDYPDAVPISAKWGLGLERLLQRIQETLDERLVRVRARIPYERSELVALAHERGHVEREEHTPDGTVIEARLPRELAQAFRRYGAGA
jgi:GTP-binding protein HflX